LGILIRFVVTFIAVFVTSQWILPGQFSIDSVQNAAIFALLLAVINALIRPVVLMLTCPVQLLTLGLSALIINALLFWLAASLVPGVQINGFIGAFLAAIVVSVVSWGVSLVVRS
jgi:putative membrane protein